MRLEGYTGINGRLLFYSEGEASDNKILNYQYHFWRMLRPYGIHVYTRVDPLRRGKFLSHKFKVRNLGEGSPYGVK